MPTDSGVVATLLDTSALVAFLRRSPPPGAEAVAAVAASEIRARAAVLSAVTVLELIVGARDASAQSAVLELLGRLPVVAADREIAEIAGRMGRQARGSGAAVPAPDLLIAATGRWLGIPLLTCDSDFARGRDLARASGPGDPWSGFNLHPASHVG